MVVRAFLAHIPRSFVCADATAYTTFGPARTVGCWLPEGSMHVSARRSRVQVQYCMFSRVNSYRARWHMYVCSRPTFEVGANRFVSISLELGPSVFPRTVFPFF